MALDSSTPTGFQLAACAEMVFLKEPFLNRVSKISDLGLQVEIWDWWTKDIASLVKTGAVFSSMTGYRHGNIFTKDGAEAMLTTAEQAIAVAKDLGITRLVIHPGELVEGRAAIPVFRTDGEMWLTAKDALTKMADLAESNGVVFCLENLNTVLDHAGVPLARAKDTLALISAVNRPGVKLMLDLYHAQIGEGNLIELLTACQNHLGEIQIADVPGRCEPGTGEINYSNIASHLRKINYRGVIGFEGYALKDSTDALKSFIAAFS